MVRSYIHAMSGSIRRKVTIREKKFKVAILGAKSVGKSAVTVRAKAKKFIHTYAPNMESKCTFTTTIDGDTVNIELIDTAALQTAENIKLEEKIKWADAFILVYSITDQSSLASLLAAKCLLNLYAKRRRITSSGNSVPDLVALVGNKNDLEHERMISEEEGRMYAEVNDCTHFFELSARESYECVKTVFDCLYRSFLIKPTKHSPSTLPRMAGSSMKIPAESSEKARIQAARRERTTTAINIFAGNETGNRTSPVIFRKIPVDSSVYSSSPDQSLHESDADEEINFVAEQIIDSQMESSSPTARRITVCGSPATSKKVSKYRSKSKQRRLTAHTNEYYRSTENRESSEHSDTNNNSMKGGTT